jgi:2-hydroxychromene-2-carboxylate isomerase
MLFRDALASLAASADIGAAIVARHVPAAASKTMREDRFIMTRYHRTQNRSSSIQYAHYYSVNPRRWPRDSMARPAIWGKQGPARRRLALSRVGRHCLLRKRNLSLAESTRRTILKKSVDFYYDFVSSASYLAYKRLPSMIKSSGGHINWKPMVLGGVFKAVGNVSPAHIEAKGKWLFDDMKRIADKHGFAFSVNPAFPLNTIMALRGAIAAERLGPEVLSPYMDVMFDGAWANGDDLSNPEVVMELMEKAGLPAVEIANLAQDQAIKDELRANTEDAVKRGAFGAPTFYVNDEMHWGQDRLDAVMEALEKQS